MNKFAVGFLNFYDNELVIEIIEASDWREAAMKHSKSIWNCLEEPDSVDFSADKEDEEDTENETQMAVPLTLEKAKREAFDVEGTFDCVEILS